MKFILQHYINMKHTVKKQKKDVLPGPAQENAEFCASEIEMS